MRLLQVPGVALAVVERGDVAQAEGFGYCSIDRPTKISASTPFRLGSTTKSLTSLLVAALVDRGDVDWTTPITNLLPEFALADQEAARTLLLKHTMGACCDMPTRKPSLFSISVTTAQKSGSRALGAYGHNRHGAKSFATQIRWPLLAGTLLPKVT